MNFHSLQRSVQAHRRASSAKRTLMNSHVSLSSGLAALSARSWHSCCRAPWFCPTRAASNSSACLTTSGSVSSCRKQVNKPSQHSSLHCFRNLPDWWAQPLTAFS